MTARSFFRLRSLAGNTWPAIPPADGSQVWSAYLELGRTQWLGHEEIIEGQLEQFRLLLQHCLQHVPHYRKLFGSLDIIPSDIRTLQDFQRIPVLTRHTYQDNSGFVAQQLPPGTVAVGKAFTSGTSGMPVQVGATNLTTLMWLAFYLRDLEWCNIDPRGTLAVIRTLEFSQSEKQLSFRRGMSLPYWNSQIHHLIETGQSHGLDIHEEPGRQLQWLQEIAPDYLLSYPSILTFLAHLILEGGEKIPRLKCIQSMSETLDETNQLLIEQAFGVPVKNMYSCREAGYLASPCQSGQGLHVHAENVILEILDDQHRPCQPGQTGTVVLTALHNFLTPLIRYEILDEATLASEQCPCGRGLPLLRRVDGKVHPMLNLATGSKKNSAALVVALQELGGIRQHQIIQKATDQVQVRIVPKDRWTQEQSGQIARMIDDYLESRVHTVVEVLDRIELPVNGKLRVVVVEMDDNKKDSVRRL